MLWLCLDCATRYAVGCVWCPQCASPRYEEDGDMPKIHNGRPPTDAADIPDVVVPKELREDYREPLEEARRPSPRKRNTRARAGAARGTGASS